MDNDTKMACVLILGALAFFGMAFSSCNWQEQRKRESEALKDASSLTETCVVHPSARHVVVQ